MPERRVRAGRDRPDLVGAGHGGAPPEDDARGAEGQKHQAEERRYAASKGLHTFADARRPDWATLRRVRQLSVVDAIGLGINGIVGSGIYLLVAPLAVVAGRGSVAGVLLCAGVCSLIALSFAELASMYDDSGGPYLYARDAFGRWVAFGVGWLGAVLGVLGLAAVSAGFAVALTRFLPSLAGVRTWVAVALIALLGLINYRGVKSGARASTFLSVAKIVPLALLAIAGLAHAPKAHLTFELHGAVQAAFLSIFMMSGFEWSAVPAGEFRNPRTQIPIALVSSLAIAACIYAALQTGALAVLPDVAQRQHPLPDLAEALFGPWAGRAINVAALVSMAGFCAGVALAVPRYFTALARDGHLPQALTAQSRFGTPGTSILASALGAGALAIVLGFRELVDVSNVVILSGYALSCAACLVLRVRRPETVRRVRLPLGPVIPLCAMLASIALLVSARPGFKELRFAAVLLSIGFAAWGATALAGKRRAPG